MIALMGVSNLIMGILIYQIVRKPAQFITNLKGWGPLLTVSVH